MQAMVTPRVSSSKGRDSGPGLHFCLQQEKQPNSSLPRSMRWYQTLKYDAKSCKKHTRC